ncbi:MAG: AAA family ATPase [Lachnospiraceae bacterium]|nr:AAA family ATPase [Lachnospiraceae bacterium]
MSSFMDFRLKYIKNVHDSAWGILALGTDDYTNPYDFTLANSIIDANTLELDDLLCPQLPIYGFMCAYYRFVKFNILKANGNVSVDELRVYAPVVKIISDFPNLKTANSFRDIIFKFFNAKDPEYAPEDNDEIKLLKKLELFNRIFFRYMESEISGNNPNRKYIGALEAYIRRKSAAGEIVYGADLVDFSLVYLDKNYESKQKLQTEQKIDFVDFSQHYVNLQKDILKKVISQDDAVRKFVKGLYDGAVRDNENLSGPESTFLFVGPPGVGKTYLAQTAAELSNRPYKVFYMSEYAHSSSFNGLVGFEKTWKNSKPGELTAYVEENPTAILVFDEVEKAHINTIHQFLSILEGGHLRDIYTQSDVDFTNTVVIFTTNAGRDFFEGKREMSLSALSEETLADAVLADKDSSGNAVMPPEIMSRLRKGSIIGFNYIDAVKLIPIIKNGMENGAKIINEKLGFKCEFDDSLFPYLFLYHMGAGLDARVAASRSGNFIKEAIYKITERVGEDSKNYRKATKNKDNVIVRLDVEDEDLVSELTVMPEKPAVLIVCNTTDRGKFSSAKSPVQIYYAYGEKEKNKPEDYIVRQIKEHKISAILIDPFMRESKTKKEIPLEGLSHKNTRGRKILEWVLSLEKHPDVYCMELNNRHIDYVDRQEFLAEGVKGILELPRQMKPEGRMQKLYDICYEKFLSEKIEKLYSRGQRLNFEIGHRFTEEENSETGENNAVIELKILDFRLELSMDSESREIFIADTPENRDSFDNIVGGKNAIAELKRFINYIRDPEEYAKSGQQISKGILFYGPPGSGKTKLARAMACEAGCPFISTTGTQFVMRDKRIADVFRLARKYAPSIIFIDEIESFARPVEYGGIESITKELMTEMNGFDRHAKPVFVIAATNAASEPRLGEKNIYLNDALLRRFTKKIYMKWPDRDERVEFLKKKQELLKEKQFNLNMLTENDMLDFADLTAGRSLSDIETVIELAVGQAAERGIPVTADLLMACFEESIYGEEKNYAKEHIYTTAIHEAGHAFMGFFSDEFKFGRFTPEYATIIARGGYLGLVRQRIDETAVGYSKEELLKLIRIKLAGRAAEIVFSDKKEGGLTTGASNDLEYATEIAAAILTTFGMEEGFLACLPMETILKSPLAETYYAKLNEILARELEYTSQIIRENKEKVKALADAMIDRSRLDTYDMAEILGITFDNSESSSDTEKEKKVVKAKTGAKKKTAAKRDGKK